MSKQGRDPLKKKKKKRQGCILGNLKSSLFVYLKNILLVMKLGCLQKFIVTALHSAT